MALPSAAPLHSKEHWDESLDSVPTQIGSGTKVIYSMEVDNTDNEAAAYVKLYDNASPTVGTTDPDEIIKVPAGEKLVHVFSAGDGLTFATALSAVAVTEPGTGGSSNPVNAVKACFFTSA